MVKQGRGQVKFTLNEIVVRKRHGSFRSRYSDVIIRPGDNEVQSVTGFMCRNKYMLMETIRLKDFSKTLRIIIRLTLDVKTVISKIPGVITMPSRYDENSSKNTLEGIG